MTVCVQADSRLKEKSIELQMPFSYLLRGYVIEDLMGRIYNGNYREYFWINNPGILGTDNYRQGGEDTLLFFYRQSEKRFFDQRLVPGQELSKALLEKFVEDELQMVNPNRIHWTAKVSQEEEYFVIWLTANYQDMTVPVKMQVWNLSDKNQVPAHKNITLFMTGRDLFYLAYSPENALCTYFFEIMDKLELIGSMEVYAKMNQIINTQPISGRHIIEEMLQRSKDAPNFLKEKRMEQIESYRDYGYMRKRWEQYEKKTKANPEPWSRVVERFVRFAKPLWDAMCNNEVFFDDWMPELERYLG